MQNPLNADPLVGRLPCRLTPSDTDPPNADLTEGDPQEADPHVNRMADTCKNITLSQTSFAGGNEGT